MEAHDEVSAELAAFLQEVEVTNVEQVEGSGDINNLEMANGAQIQVETDIYCN